MLRVRFGFSLRSTPGVVILSGWVPMTIRIFFRRAFQRCVVIRAVVMAMIVGSVLIAINHGACIMSGTFCRACAIQSGLTMLVPYCVSTVSCVLAHGDKIDAAIEERS